MTEPLTPAQIEEQLLKENAKELEQAVSEYIEKEGCCCEPQYIDIKTEAAPNNTEQKDSLALIFLKQKQLSDYLAKSKPSNYYHHGEERYPFERVNHCITAISSELEEIRSGLEYKWWKDYKPSDMDLICENEVGIEENGPLMEQLLKAHDKGVKSFLTDDQRPTQKQILENSKLEYLQKEIIDVWHFLVQMSIEAKLDSKKVLELYLDKNKENYIRQESGY